MKRLTALFLCCWVLPGITAIAEEEAEVQIQILHREGSRLTVELSASEEGVFVIGLNEERGVHLAESHCRVEVFRNGRWGAPLPFNAHPVPWVEHFSVDKEGWIASFSLIGWVRDDELIRVSLDAFGEGGSPRYSCLSEPVKWSEIEERK